MDPLSSSLSSTSVPPPQHQIHASQSKDQIISKQQALAVCAQRKSEKCACTNLASSSSLTINTTTPSHHARLEVTLQDMMSLYEKKRSLWFYINDEDENEKALSQECLLVLQKAFKNCTLPTKYYFSDLSFPTNKKNKSSFTIVKYTPPKSTQ
ncbi:hypothetical protein C9374_006295 [Naegleria lovaniensis]|uniref:Uncharacterized protein n=1 Tax=Naegleria lovaniensis TaxID=51637 RepID=A0AA88KMC1_NAELO|nr:uncharacterized protein C9374_006295 [Naegleria lovaniensis]KAG2381306.1 hypothetical protein C9374_006295 [Naegleria lovaniensis]